MYGIGKHYGREYTEVHPQDLTPEGRKVERAVAEYKRIVNPPYFVTGVGCRKLPVLKITTKSRPNDTILFQNPYRNVEEMYALGEESQVGTVKDTLFRPDARRSKEFSNIEILNKSWDDVVTTACNQIRNVLAPGAKKVNAELYKLLMYKKGDFFHRHQDAQRSARMFATLLFFLPMKYTGGDFHIEKDWEVTNVIKDFRVHQVYENEHTYIGPFRWVAFYTDVHHEVLEVKEGFRVVLNYSLSFEGFMSPSPCLPRFGHSTVQVVTDYFATEKKKHLAIPLSYQYTQATLFPDFLKGIDACLFNAIGEVATPELRFVLVYDKTKVIPQEEECDHKRIFRGVFLVKHEEAKKCFEIMRKYQPQLDEAHGHDWTILREKCDGEYVALMNASQRYLEFDLEWVVERESGNTKYRVDTFTHLRFEKGQFGWLGNEAPAEEYYYLHAAIVVRANK